MVFCGQSPSDYPEFARFLVELGKVYLEVAKKKKVKRKKLRKAIKTQLKYIKRNIEYIDELIDKGSSLKLLTLKEYKDFLVITELQKHQSIMYEANKQTIPDRIVSDFYYLIY